MQTTSFPPNRSTGRSIGHSSWATFVNHHQLGSSLWRELIIDAAIASFSCTTAEVEARLTELQANASHPNDLPDEADIVRQLRIEKFQAATWNRHLSSYFLKHKSRFDQVVYSLIRVNSKFLAMELYARINDENIPFNQLAREFSQGFEAYTCGVVGPQSIAAVPPLIQAQFDFCADLRAANRISLPIPLAPDCWAIVRLDSWLPAALDDELQNYLRQELFEQWLTAQVAARMQSEPIALETAIHKWSAIAEAQESHALDICLAA